MYITPPHSLLLPLLLLFCTIGFGFLICLYVVRRLTFPPGIRAEEAVGDELLSIIVLCVLTVPAMCLIKCLKA